MSPFDILMVTQVLPKFSTLYYNCFVFVQLDEYYRFKMLNGFEVIQIGGMTDFQC
jgi:hypothetical protein